MTMSVDVFAQADVRLLGRAAHEVQLQDVPQLVEAAYRRGYRAGMQAAAVQPTRPTATNSVQAPLSNPTKVDNTKAAASSVPF